MKELNQNEVLFVSGGIPPMAIVWGVYTVLSPFVAWGFASGATAEEP